MTLGGVEGMTQATTQTAVTKRLVAHFTVPGEPVSKERARVTAHGTYTPQKTRDAEQVVLQAFIVQNPAYALQALKRPTDMFELRCEFSNGNRRPRDLDNMAKLVQDALNKKAFTDDSRIFDLQATKRIVNRDAARTEVWLYLLDLAAVGFMGKETKE